MRTDRIALGLAFLVLLGAPPLAAQGAEEGIRIFEREIFDYPSADRRDPFLPLNTGERIGPNFNDLRLTGILHNPAVASVATVTDQKTGRRYRVREGDRLGEATVLEIRPREAVFLITSYGISRREVLRVKRERERDG